jgi:D-sedoheptulose 7-phosphate isomerase
MLAMSNRTHLLESIRSSAATIAALEQQAEQIDRICSVVVNALRAGGKILTAGHGGSAAEALHMAEELVGRFKHNRRPLPAIALVADPTLITCIANDFGFEQLFPRQVEALGQKGDVFFIFSSSGNGEGFRLAIEAAKRKGVTTVALLGKTGGIITRSVDHELIIPGDETARIQEAQGVIMHLILEAVEREKW